MPKYLLQKTKQELFDNHQLTVDNFKELIIKISILYLNNDIKEREYKALLDWLLYCSINKLISLFPNNASISNIVNCINNGDLSNININMQNYNKYREITRVILKHLTHFISYRLYEKYQNKCGPITIMVNCFNTYKTLKKQIIQYIHNSLELKYINNINVNNESIVIDDIRRLFIDAFNNLNMMDEWRHYANKVFTGNYRVISDLAPLLREIAPLNKQEVAMKNAICKLKSDFFLEKLFDHINY